MYIYTEHPTDQNFLNFVGFYQLSTFSYMEIGFNVAQRLCLRITLKRDDSDTDENVDVYS